jgi:hypothetical protein
MVFWSRKHQGIYGGFAEDFEGFMEDLRRILGDVGFEGDERMRVWGGSKLGEFFGFPQVCEIATLHDREADDN